MTSTYAPTCPACRDNRPDTFYVHCSGCQARRRQLQAPPPPPSELSQAQIEAMDSTMQPLEPKGSRP